MSPQKDKLSRADQIRARRKLEPVHPKKALVEEQAHLRNAENISKVVARRQNPEAEHKPVSPAVGKKSIYVRTNNRGSEIRLPALPHLRLPWRILSGLIVIACAVGIYFLKFSDMFKVTSINLAGTNRISQQALLGAMKVQNSSMMDLHPEDLQTRILAAFPEIRKVNVMTRLPNEVNVLVFERQPLITWFLNDKPAYWIDEEGYSFPIRGEQIGTPYFIYADGEPPYPLGYPMDLQINPSLSKQLPRLKLNPSVDENFVQSVVKLNERLPESYTLRFEKGKGLAWEDPHGWTVYFGDRSADMEQKLNEYDAIAKAILDKNLQPSMVSMQFLHAPYYRTEP
ncbi:MAG: FtsQ-type POTRA domain-containing protein [Anaerolineaceae bacterium]|nr:FtsQ-type POTRA domain-containing protein [Anaerolineaceae bacterium]